MLAIDFYALESERQFHSFIQISKQPGRFDEIVSMESNLCWNIYGKLHRYKIFKLVKYFFFCNFKELTNINKKGFILFFIKQVYTIKDNRLLKVEQIV